MAIIVLAFALLFVAAAVFYGGLALRRSERGNAALRNLLNDHPKLVGGLLLAAIVGLSILGLVAIYFGASGIG